VRATSTRCCPCRTPWFSPNIVTTLFVGRDRPVRASRQPKAMDVPLLVVAQRDPEVAKTGYLRLYNVGCAVEIGRVLHMPDGSNHGAGAGHRACAHPRGR